MPSSNFRHSSFSLLVFGITLAAFNIAQWSQPPSVLAEIKPRLGRTLASVDEQADIKPRTGKVLAYDCTNPQPLKTPEPEIRIALLNCSELSKKTTVFNKQNWFQATLFQSDELTVTDYIPLVDKDNTIEVQLKPNSKTKLAHYIMVHRTTNDAR